MPQTPRPGAQIKLTIAALSWLFPVAPSERLMASALTEGCKATRGTARLVQCTDLLCLLRIVRKRSLT